MCVCVERESERYVEVQAVTLSNWSTTAVFFESGAVLRTVLSLVDKDGSIIPISAKLYSIQSL